MQIRKRLIMSLRAIKNAGGRWDGGQQQLFTALSGKRNLFRVRCCPKCLREVMGQELYHSCGEFIVEVQIKEPQKIPGGYVSPWG